MYKRFIKRVLDFVVSLFGIIIFTIPILVIGIIVKLDSPGPIFFVQKRVGAHKKYFNIIKFRTMRIEAPSEMSTKELDDPFFWITRSGRILRRTSLDELPQLFNILSGKMSIIGPRPHLWNDFDIINERDKYGANDIKPGLTGWAQINGRDELSTAEKAALDG